MAIPLFFRKVRRAIGDDEAEVASAGVIDAGVIHLIENAVAQSEPHAAFAADGRAEAGFRAAGPTSRNTRPAGGEFLLNHVATYPGDEASHRDHSPRTGWRRESGRESHSLVCRAGS